MTPRRPHPLDRPSARLAALAVLAATVALLAAIHRDDLWPSPATADAAATPSAFAACLAARRVTIDRMRAEAVIDAAQAALFTRRAEALCRDQHGG